VPLTFPNAGKLVEIWDVGSMHHVGKGKAGAVMGLVYATAVADPGTAEHAPEMCGLFGLRDKRFLCLFALPVDNCGT
jgi:hypothetical protein